ncbi:hypothetical protein D187_002394 [Cystobacter fuscus DSM 2262]|uniref:Uncharacterized protein n=1 Tax=Cystobacter fuscus (strain ATCC 25194 / DSM 2262 / NBRC 100088 / M29) TaxID=1242864 RepID=S9P5F0_CYSF2|nr:hypothetical protein D187_002394 [Cystobacter fuscus DSM 2262]
MESLSTIRSADLIVVMARSGAYAELLHAQLEQTRKTARAG